ncbi:YncE family protein [Baekduia sp. Peel2402]|uniref:YncE family protein n=1 Tax=Baekduia sp. Peel2402 TaxID=3458296 RepID=UPI00403E9DD0
MSRTARPRRLGAAALIGATALVATPAVVQAAPVNQPGWSSSSQTLNGGINLGYETAIDPVNHRLYATDAQPTTATKTPVKADDGTVTGYVTAVTIPSTGKVVAFDTNTNALLRNWSFTGLLGSDGVAGGGYTFGTPNPTTGIATGTNRGTANVPYGVAVDHGVADPTIVTVQTRTSSVAIFPQSQTSPKDTDILTAAANGFFRARTPVVDSTHHKAYFVNYNATTGTIAQLDLATKTVERTIAVPGAVGLALDEANSILYAGTFGAAAGNVLYVIDLTTGTITDTIPGIGNNARPGFDPVGKKVYTANSGDRTISVVDVDPASPTYHQVVKTIAATGSPNAIAVDADRRLVYSADLGSHLVSVIDADTDEWVLGVPTLGNALDVDVDPATGVAYVSNQYSGSTTGQSVISAISVARAADLPQGPVGPAGPAGPAGKDGAAGVNGASGTTTLAISLAKFKVSGRTATVTAPAAGKLTAVAKSGKTTVATGTVTAKKAGSYKISLKASKAGKKLLAKKAVKATITVSFVPKSEPDAAVQRTAKATLAQSK